MGPCRFLNIAVLANRSLGALCGLVGDRVAGGFGGIHVVGNIHVAAQVLGTQDGEHDNIGVDSAHEDADHNAVVVPLHAIFQGGKREALADGSFDSGAGGRDEVTQLIRGTDDESTECTGRKFHEMNGYNTPGALDGELFEEGGGDDPLVGDESVGVEQGTTDDAHHDDTKPTTKDLGAESNNGTSGDGAHVGDNLRHGDLVCVESELVLEQCRVQILRAVRHEVEAGHEQDQVDENEPVTLQRDLSFLYEGFADAAVRATQLLVGDVGVGLGHEQPPDDEEGGRRGAEPVQRSPAVRCRVHEGAGKGGGQEIARGVTLLQHTAEQATGLVGDVFESGRGGVAVETAHGDAEEGASSKELAIRASESSSL